MTSPGTPSKASTTTQQDESTRVFAAGLLRLMQPIVMDCDAQMQAVFRSQAQLSDQIDTLTAELERFMSIANSPSPSLLAPVHTLIRAKQRLLSISNTLHTIKDRLDRMEKMAHSDVSGTSSIPEVFTSLFEKIRAPQVVPPKTADTLSTSSTIAAPAPSSPTKKADEAPYVSAAVDEKPTEDKQQQQEQQKEEPSQY